jgi:3-(3-hydroxy-phenyl)propionate hydroxylase
MAARSVFPAQALVNKVPNQQARGLAGGNHGDLDCPVGIVGAGPVGLACALRLASFGVRSLVLEAEPTLLKQGSKACLIQGDVLEVLDKCACAEQIDREGVTWHVARTYVRGKEIVKKVYPRPVGYGPFTNISQYRIQQLMLARLEENPLVEVRWSHRVVGLEQDAHAVTARVETPDGERELRFRYLVACDGVRSRLRDLVGVEWTGYTHGDRFLITDIRAPLAFAHERHFHYDPPFNPGRQLVIHAQPDDVWRVDFQLSPDADIDEERRTGALDRRIRAVIGDVPYEIDWLSTYRFYQRVVEHMRVGRVFFAGDAAHALPPYGARGMNSGIQDADNLAWKLAFVLSGHADETLLDSYHDERHAAARENLRVTEATIRFMVPSSRLRRSLRNLLLRLAWAAKPLRRHVNAGRMAEPYTYVDSPIVDSSGGHPLVGSFAPDLPIFVGGARTRLRRLLGEQFVVLCFARDFAAAWRLADEIYARGLPLPVRVVVVLPPGTETGGVTVPATVAHDEDPERSATYRGEGTTWYLVRPDGHIAAVRADEHAAELADLLVACGRAVSHEAPADEPLARERRRRRPASADGSRAEGRAEQRSGGSR